MSHEIVPPSDFTPAVKLPENLTAELLAEMHSIGRHYGLPKPSGDTQIFNSAWFGLEGSLFIITGTSPEDRQMVISKRIMKDHFFIRTLCGLVMWDLTIDAEFAVAEVKRINEVAESLGLYDPKTGERRENHGLGIASLTSGSKTSVIS